MVKGSVLHQDMAGCTFASPALAAASAGDAQVVTLRCALLPDGVPSERHLVCTKQMSA